MKTPNPDLTTMAIAVQERMKNLVQPFPVKDVVNAFKIEKMKTWDNTLRSEIDTPQEMSDFFKDIEAVCKKHNLSISQDGYGQFEIERYNPDNMEWLKVAAKNYD